MARWKRKRRRRAGRRRARRRRAGRWRARRRRAIRWAVAAFLVAWALQLAFLHVRLGELRWSDYWALRGFYRPGLIAFRNVAEPVLPGYYFSWASKRGATAGFVFATGLYALPVIPLGMFWALRKH